ncbi:MAG TPA: COR domain-containing protein [Chthoniobacteraceae bacterium]|jgi:GTPase SAR1 family protein|nr:COR domain-containing protein [Chthoniobacteraceae bacterium]
MPAMTQEEQQAYDKALERIERCRCAGATELDLSSLGLTRVPPELGQLSALTRLFLHNNQLAALPPELGQLSALTELYLANNQLAALPPELGQLSDLTELYLDRNQLTALPAELGQLSALTGLYLANNQLTALPPELGQLSALTRLWLHNNRLTALPAELGQLSKLALLILEDNRLTSLPAGLGRLAALQELTLHGNDGLGLPPELLGPRYLDSSASNPPANPQAILDFYFARQLEGEAPMREVRVLLVGRGRVGKTSLLKRLRGGKLDAHEPETPGITVLPLPLQCAQGAATGHAWDFGGQEFLHGTHQIFLSERCVYLLVLEGRESNWETETDYWLRFIQSFGGDSPVVVALNKYDAHKFSVDRFRLQERCPQIAGFVETDALTGLGIAQLRALIEETVNAMPDVWLGVPRRWHRVKERLGKMEKSFLDYKEYQALCAAEQVTDEGQQASLAETLHRLGIALNFRDHQRLKETSVLKPQWVTEGIYGVLRSLQAKDCHGVLERAWLAEALPAEDYPEEKHGFLLELMEKFEVAFALGEAEGAEVISNQRAVISSGGAGVRSSAALKPQGAAQGLITDHCPLITSQEGAEVISNQSAVISSGGGAASPGAAQGLITDHCSLITSGTRWLIPELLPEVQPAAFAEFAEAGVKRLRFAYPEALPPGLLPRFIVRTHELSAAHPEWRWRSGVVLEWGEAKALVRLDRSERRTEVAVRGGSADEAQSLFEIIRAHLVVLHGKVRTEEELELAEHPGTWVSMEKLRLLEQDGQRETAEKTKERSLVKVQVTPALDTTESPEARAAEGPAAPPRLRLFVSYAHKDASQIKKLSAHLTILGRQGYIQTWDDKQLIAGEAWEERILEELGEADVVLMIHSTASLESAFIQEKEMPLMLARAREQKCVLIPVPLDRPMKPEDALKPLMTATWNAKPVLDFKAHRKGWMEVEDAIRKAVEARRKRGP